MIVTPFELTFVAQGDKQCSSMLFMMNTVINFAFFVDMVIMHTNSAQTRKRERRRACGSGQNS